MGSELVEREMTEDRMVSRRRSAVVDLQSGTFFENWLKFFSDRADSRTASDRFVLRLSVVPPRSLGGVGRLPPVPPKGLH